jgi:hypothetical protein
MRQSSTIRVGLHGSYVLYLSPGTGLRWRLVRCGFDGLHRREQKHFLDVWRVFISKSARKDTLAIRTGRIREEHDQAIDAETPSTSRRKAMLQPELYRIEQGKGHKTNRTHASTNVSSMSCASSSPCAFCLTCSSKRSRCSKGSFSSVYALQNSLPQRKPSKRSQRPGRDRCHLARGDITCGCPTGYCERVSR